MFERFNDGARRAVVLASEEARMLNHNYIGTEHILLGLIHEPQGVGYFALESLGISLDDVREQVRGIIGQGQQAPPSGHLPFTPRAKMVLELGLREALQLGHNYIGTEHILLGLIREGEGVAAQVLVKLGADLNRVRPQVNQLLSGYQGKDPESIVGPAEGAPSGSLVLDQFGLNLTQAARMGKLDPVIGREKEIERVMQVLSRRTKNNPVLIGEPGVGKTAIVNGFAHAIAQGEVPLAMRETQLYSLDLGAMVAGARDRVTFEDRLSEILKEIRTRGDVILATEDISTLMATDAGHELGDVGLLRSALTRGEVRLVANCPTEALTRLLRRDAWLESLLQPIPVAGPSLADAVEILKGVRDRLEAHHRVSITDRALTSAVTLADRHLNEHRLPAIAIDLIDEAGAQLQLRNIKMPPDLREYDVKISQTRREKESAIDARDFVQAAALRDTEKELMAAKAEREKQWKAGDLHIVVEVDEELIQDVVAQRLEARSGLTGTTLVTIDLDPDNQGEDLFKEGSGDVWADSL